MAPKHGKHNPADLLKEIKRLHEEISYYKTMLDQLPVGVYRTSRTGRFIRANPALTKILGFSQDELKHRRAPEFFSDPDDRQEQLVTWKNKTGVTCDELRLKTKDGRTLWVRDTGKAILDENNEINYFDGVIEDITIRKEALAALKQSEEQLRHVQKMDALGRLASGVAHDINNVLGAVMGSASSLRFEKESDSPNSEDLENILKACKKGRELTRNLLGFARKGRGVESVISPNAVIEDLLSLLKRTIPKKIRIKQNLAEDLYHIKGDLTQTGQALMNVCLNALDSMEGEGTLEFVTRNTLINEEDMPISKPLLAGNYIEIVVSDTGSGIATDTLERVFEPFFTTKEKGKGTGLGLSMVYGIVQNQNGHVQVRSEVGKGTRVEFLFPTVLAQEVALQPELPSQPMFHLGDKKKALLIDDEPTILRAHGRMLEQLGFEVVQTRYSPDASGLFRTHLGEIAIVLLDLVMPVLDGGEVFHNLKEIDPNVRVVICSGYTKGDKIERLLAGGAAAFLQKPFEMKALVDTIAKVME